MSALSLMHRKLMLGFALATFAVSCAHAYAAQDPAPGKAHPQNNAAPASRRHHRVAVKRTGARHHITATRNPSPRSTGRTAGLAIRRQLALKRKANRALAFKRNHPHKPSRKDFPAEAASASMLPLPSIAAGPESARTLDKDGPGNLPGDDSNGSAREANRMTSPEFATPAIHAEAEEASVRVPRGRMPAPLRGSLASLERQNERLDAEGLERIEDEADLADRIEHKLLVPIPVSNALSVNPELPALHRYCRPWTARFLVDVALAHDALFHKPLEVSSAVRTIEYQKRLMRINGNAAAAEGDIVSPHLTGATIDIAKDGLSRAEIAWMRRRLLALEEAGKIDVEEEFHQECFHITVYKSYAPEYSATQDRSGSAHKSAGSSSAVNTQGL